MMNQFLGQNNYAWGANILSDIIDGKDWELSGNFPRIALCDFTVNFNLIFFLNKKFFYRYERYQTFIVTQFNVFLY